MIEQNMGVTCKELFTAIKEYAEIVGVTIGTQKDETRRYACGPIPVDVTLPEGEHYSSSYTQDREFKRIGVRPPNMYWE